MSKFIEPSLVQKEIAKSLYAFNASKELAYAINAKENIVLFGDGGFGKSEAAVILFYFLKKHGWYPDQEHPYILSFGQGMTTEKLLSGIKVKEFMSDGVIEYNLAKAFTSASYVIFEELFDASLQVLLELKDILQRRTVVMNGIAYPIKTEFIVACTNRDRSEVITDASAEALFQRFPFEVKVGWSSFTENDYFLSLCASFKVEPKLASIYFKIVARACAEVARNKPNEKISPRTAYKAMKAVISNNYDLNVLNGFYNIRDFYKKAMEAFQVTLDDEKQKIELVDILAKAKKLQETAQLTRSAIGIICLAKEAKLLLEDVTSVRDANVKYYQEVKNNIASIVNEMYSLAKTRIHNPPKNTLAYFIKTANASSFDWDLIDLERKR